MKSVIVNTPVKFLRDGQCFSRNPYRVYLRCHQTYSIYNGYIIWRRDTFDRNDSMFLSNSYENILVRKTKMKKPSVSKLEIGKVYTFMPISSKFKEKHKNIAGQAQMLVVCNQFGIIEKNKELIELFPGDQCIAVNYNKNYDANIFLVKNRLVSIHESFFDSNEFLLND